MWNADKSVFKGEIDSATMSLLGKKEKIPNQWFKLPLKGRRETSESIRKQVKGNETENESFLVLNNHEGQWIHSKLLLLDD